MAEPRLDLLTRENVRAACDLRLRPDQEHLVAPVAYSLAEAYVVPDIAWPRLIYDADQLVGFVMAAFDPENEDDVYRAYLWRLNVAADHQRGGYGRFAVAAVCREALDRGLTKLTVSYHPGEDGPEAFYHRLGFQPTGRIIYGEAVAERPLAVGDPLLDAAS
jgi:diamine N-acetyltransferase